MKATARALCGVSAGIAVGFLMSCYMFSAWKLAAGELKAHWTLLTWGDHWALRGAASLLGFALAGFFTGAVSRKHARILSLVAIAPTLILWLGALFLGTRYGVYFPIGYQFIAIVVLIAAPYITIKTAGAGEEFGAAHAAHFDSRPKSILGINWYHYFWIPIYMWFWFVLIAPIALALLSSIRMAFRVGPTSMFVIVPFIFVFGWYKCFELFTEGGLSAYNQLAGFAPSDARHSMAKDLFRGPAVALIIFFILTVVYIIGTRMVGAR